MDIKNKRLLERAKKIVKKEVFAFSIEASPPVIVSCAYAINKKGITLFNNPIVKKVKRISLERLNFKLVKKST